MDSPLPRTTGTDAMRRVHGPGATHPAKPGSQSLTEPLVSDPDQGDPGVSPGKAVVVFDAAPELVFQEVIRVLEAICLDRVPDVESAATHGVAVPPGLRILGLGR